MNAYPIASPPGALLAPTKDCGTVDAGVTKKATSSRRACLLCQECTASRAEGPRTRVSDTFVTPFHKTVVTLVALFSHTPSLTSLSRASPKLLCAMYMPFDRRRPG